MNADLINISLNKNKIMYCLADCSYTFVVMEDGTQYRVAKRIIYFEKMLTQKKFFRCHRSSIINIRFIKNVVKASQILVIMKDKHGILVSYRKKAEFLKLF